MKKLLISVLLITTSFTTYAGSQLDFTLSDFCYQQPNVQDRGGIYYFPNEKEGITTSSLCVYKDLYGQYMSEVELVNGKFDGKFIRWWENGQQHQEKNYKDGLLDGKWTDWWSDGRVFFKKNYKDGKKDGKQTHWDENGQIVIEVIYKDGEILDEAAAKKIELAEAKRKKEEVKTKLAEIKREAEEAKTQEAEILAKEATAVLKEAEAKTIAEELKLKVAEAKRIALEIEIKEAEVKQTSAEFKTKEAELLVKQASKQLEQDQQNKALLELEIAELKVAEAEIQYRQLLAKEVQDEQDTARSLIIADQLTTLKFAYKNNIAARVKTFWRYQSAEDDWSAEVYVVQDRDGNVKAVEVKNANVGNSALGKSFKDSIERAINKASPLPAPPDEAVFDKELYFIFSVN